MPRKRPLRRRISDTMLDWLPVPLLIIGILLVVYGVAKL